MIHFTKKQGQYLAFIHQYMKLNGVPPAEADMGEYFRKTPAAVHLMVKTLEQKGLISKVPYAPHTIKVAIPANLIPPLGETVSQEVKPGLKTGSPGGKKLWSQDSYIQAYRFAAEAHHGQTYPGTSLPYIMHPSLVSMEIMTCLTIEPHHAGDFAVSTALLHDVLEDTAITFQEIEGRFGKIVAEAVSALTKNEYLPKDEQMPDSLARIRSQPKEVWMVKMADRITNLGPPPHYWSSEKIALYRMEAIQIYKALHAASVYLSKRLIEKIEGYEA